MRKAAQLTRKCVMQAFAVAAHSSQAHCTLGLNGAQTPLMPDLLADVAPKLPDMDGIPLPDLEVRTASTNDACQTCRLTCSPSCPT